MFNVAGDSYLLYYFIYVQLNIIKQNENQQ